MNFEKIYGYDHIKKELNVIIDILNNTEKYQSTGAKLPAGVLLHGAPGLGKTLFANEFINALTNRKVYIIRKNKPDGEFVNYLNDTITDAIKCAPAIVFFDDMDKFANDDERHRNSEEFVTIQSLIDDAKDKNVFFIATTNDIRNIPASLLRDGRFDYMYYLNSPEVGDSAKIIEHYLEGKNIASDIDYTEVAKLLQGESCATLEKVINEATIATTYNNKSVIERNDIINAILRVVYDGPEIDEKNEYAQNLAIYHEAGHALVAEMLDKGSVDLVSVGNYFSNKGGITAISNPDNYWNNLSSMENRVRVLLAGKAATELYLKTTDLGVSSDLERAQRLITRIIEVYAENNFNYWAVAGKRSEQKLVQFENDAAQKFESFYFDTKKILLEHRDEYLKIVDLLKNKKLITQKELQPIFA